MAKAKGEFDKENLDVEIKQMPSTDAITSLAKGQIDALYSAPEAAFVNAAKQNFDVKWVLGNYSSDPKSKSGVWARLRGRPDRRPGRPQGQVLRLAGRQASIIMYPIASVLDKHNAKPTDVDFKRLDAQGVAQALENGGVDAAWLLDPVWKNFDNKPGYAFLGGQPAGGADRRLPLRPEPAGEEPRRRRRVRAGADPHDQHLLRGRLQVRPRRSSRNSPPRSAASPNSSRPCRPLVTDWEIRKGTVDKAQEQFVAGKVVEAPALPEDKLVDRSFYAEAVGHNG
ncbi:ABC transporter substrate-binding protein [Yinghuangia aomiensis]